MTDRLNWLTDWLTEGFFGFPVSTSGKQPSCQCKRQKRCSFDPWIWKIPWRAWQPTPVFLPGESHEQRSLAGYCPLRSQRLGHDWNDLACTSHLYGPTLTSVHTWHTQASQHVDVQMFKTLQSQWAKKSIAVESSCLQEGPCLASSSSWFFHHRNLLAPAHSALQSVESSHNEDSCWQRSLFPTGVCLATAGPPFIVSLREAAHVFV